MDCSIYNDFDWYYDMDDYYPPTLDRGEVFKRLAQRIADELYEKLHDDMLRYAKEKESTYLARPWRDYGKAVFSNCTYEDHIHPLLFHDWSDVDRKKTCRLEEYPLKEGRASFTRNKKGSVLPKQYRALLDDFKKFNA